MFTLFRRKAAPPPPPPPPAADISPAPMPTPPAAGLIRPASAAALLATPRRQKLLAHIWQRTALSRAQFATLYRTPLERYAALVQQFPASESHHHAYPGGLLDHGLEIVAYALKLRQSHLLPVGAPSEVQAAQTEAWTAGVAYAALLHDIGKIAVDLQIEQADGQPWHPWHGPLAQPYRLRYRPEREYRLHGAATGLLYTQVLDREILDWLSGYAEVWAALLYVLAGQHEHAGVLGELVMQADQASVALALGGDPVKALAAPRHALQRKLLDGLRYLIKEEFKLNQPQASDGWLTQDALWLVSKTVSDKLRAHLLSQGMDGIPSSNTAVFDVLQDHGIAQATADGKAIWRAFVTSPGGWSHGFTFLKLSPALIWETADRPAPFMGTVQVEAEGAPASDEASGAARSAEVAASSTAQAAPSPAEDGVGALLNLLDIAPPLSSPLPPPSAQAAQPRLADPPPQRKTTLAESASQASPEPSGAHFIDWLRQSIQSRRLIINDAKALVHTVADTAYLVSPGVFQRYAQEHPRIATAAKQEGVVDWQWVQKRFEQLRLHRKQSNGLNIWICEVTGPRKSRRLHGYLLTDANTLFDATPISNPYLKLVET